jgi:hypothetical protein
MRSQTQQQQQQSKVGARHVACARRFATRLFRSLDTPKTNPSKQEKQKKERGRIEASWRRFATVLGVLDMSKRRTLDKSKTPVPPQKSNLDRSADSFGKSPTGVETIRPLYLPHQRLIAPKSVAKQQNWQL